MSDWFAPDPKRLANITSKNRAKRVALDEAIQAQNRIRRENPTAAAEAAKLFGAVASGRAPMAGSGVPPASFGPVYRGGTIYPVSAEPRDAFTQKPSMKPKDGLKAIIKAVRNADDPHQAAGEWITRITTEILDAVRELEEDMDVD